MAQSNKIDIAFYERCIATLRKAYSLLQTTDATTVEYDIYRSACVKEFEIILEQSGKLLKKILKPYYHSPKVVDALMFKEIFRHAALRDLVSVEACERWLLYRDNRNSTAHDYGVNFAEETLLLLPSFIEDATALTQMIDQQNNLRDVTP